MGIILDRDTKVMVQGITGKESRFWTKKMLEAGTNITCGVTPGKGGEMVHGVPVFDTVEEAVQVRDANMAVSFVPARFTRDAVFEIILAGIKKMVVLADGVPIFDTLEILNLADQHGVMLIGPNTPGIATVGEGMLGFIPVWQDSVYQKGSIGIISRSGSLINLISSFVVESGFGVSSIVGCGGDPVPGTRFSDILELFKEDPETEAIIIVGEIGGSMEEEVAEYVLERGFSKPMLAYIAGRTAPPGKQMGHAGAIISQGKGSMKGKKKALNAAGIRVADAPKQIGKLLKEIFKGDRAG